MTPWALLLLTAALGGVGAGLRYAVDAAVMRGRRDAFPLGILVVNATGSFALGILAGVGTVLAGEWATILGMGLLGGYTTFSTVSVETVLLGQRRRVDWAWINLIGTLGVCVVAAALGLLAGRLIGGVLPG